MLIRQCPSCLGILENGKCQACGYDGGRANAIADGDVGPKTAKRTAPENPGPTKMVVYGNVYFGVG